MRGFKNRRLLIFRCVVRMGKPSKIGKASEIALQYMLNEGLKRSPAIYKALDDQGMKRTKKHWNDVNGEISKYLSKHPEDKAKLNAKAKGDGDENPITTPPPPPTRPIRNDGGQINYVQAFGLLETGSGPTDLLAELNLDPDQLIQVLSKWNTIKEKIWEKDAIEAKYVPAWFEVAQSMGEKIRGGCKEWIDSTGTCRLWDFKADSDMRSKFSGLFKIEGGRTRAKVGQHPEICSLCHRGIAFTLGVPE